MSRRIRVNLTRWVCRMIGHNLLANSTGCRHVLIRYCDRCGRVW